MATTFRLPKEEPLLNIASYARGGPRAADRLAPSQIEQIRLTVNRAPEAVVKVLPRSSNDLKAVGKHLDYIGRRGNLELEGDDGERLHGRVADALLEDWDLDVDDVRRQGSLTAASKRAPPKLVHKLMFSMPPGTPPQKVLSAVRNIPASTVTRVPAVILRAAVMKSAKRCMSYTAWVWKNSAPASTFLANLNSCGLMGSASGATTAPMKKSVAPSKPAPFQSKPSLSPCAHWMRWTESKS